MSQISDAWFTILQAYHESDPRVTKSCLATISRSGIPPLLEMAVPVTGSTTDLIYFGRYICWIDISLIVNDRFLPAFWSFLSRDAYVDEAAGCLTEVCARPAPLVSPASQTSARNLSLVGVRIKESHSKSVSCWRTYQEKSLQVCLDNAHVKLTVGPLC